MQKYRKYSNYLFLKLKNNISKLQKLDFQFIICDYFTG